MLKKLKKYIYIKKKRKYYTRKIFILSIVKQLNKDLKITYIYDKTILCDDYKGYFIDKATTTNYRLLDLIDNKFLKKWHRVEVDFCGNVLYLYYKNKQINL